MLFLYERLAHDMPLWMQDGSGIDSLLKAGDEMYGGNEAERVGQPAMLSPSEAPCWRRKRVASQESVRMVSPRYERC